jgi:hypothetical protein
MRLLDDVKRITEKATGWRWPDGSPAVLREHKPQAFRLEDDGLVPNHPKWPLARAQSGQSKESFPGGSKEETAAS